MYYVLVMKKQAQSQPQHYHKEEKVVSSDSLANSPYYRDLLKLNEVLMNHPSTWAQYTNNRGGYNSIIDMEVAEMKDARVNKQHHEYMQELLHVGAAVINARHNMTCKEEDRYGPNYG